MKILGIDTSTADSSVAVMEGGHILGEFTVNQQRTHSESLVPIIQELLELLGLKVKDMDLFAVGIGPGSFTGIRIGVTVAKTLAQVTGKGIVGISSLEALAVNAYGPYIMPILDARGGRVYYGLFDSSMKRLAEDQLAYAKDLAASLPADKEITIIGDYNKEIRDQLAGDNISFARPIHNNLIARGICQLADKRASLGDIDHYTEIRANYVRKSQAERDMDS